MNIDEFLEIAKTAALEAGEAILNVYYKDNIETKLKLDNSPITEADEKANEIITQYLIKSNIPILSEEGKHTAFQIRKNWEYLWIVDPLDGTKEFIKRNDEFTVNIALVKNGNPIIGVVYIPVLSELYWSIKNRGAYKLDMKGKTTKLNSLNDPSKRLRIVSSRSHANKRTQSFLNQYPDAEILIKGSSLKFLILAEGKADIYPRFSPTMEWDTVAAQIILEEAGGKVCKINTNKPLEYNKENLLNPFFIASNGTTQLL